MTTEVLLFEVLTPLGFAVRCSPSYWEFIIENKHPVLRGRVVEVKTALADPQEIAAAGRTQTCSCFMGAERRGGCVLSPDTRMEAAS
jgi:hypothetical protein